MEIMKNPRPYAELIDRLRSHGVRPTRQRLALARLLFDGAPRHVSAEALHSEARAANVPVSLAFLFGAALRAAGDSRTPLVIGVITNLLNHTNWGAPVTGFTDPRFMTFIPSGAHNGTQTVERQVQIGLRLEF